MDINDVENLHRQELIELVKRLLERIKALEAYVMEQDAEIQQLRGQLGQKKPPWVKRNRPKSEGPQKPRKKRGAQHNHGRHREKPTRTEQHALERCPDCGYGLQGKSIDYTRQVIELPAPQPGEGIEHQVIKRYCPHCQSYKSPKLDLEGQVLGQGRMGIRLASTIAYLRNILRMPVRMIQVYLDTLHGLKISIGEIVELLHDVRQATEGALRALKGEMKASGILHGDETGWRENGQNGYIWSFSTPGERAVRYYEYDFSRGQAVVKRILGDEFHGHLVSDFYAGYNDYAGEHQRCWIHLLRDLHKLKEEFGQQAGVIEWA